MFLQTEDIQNLVFEEKNIILIEDSAQSLGSFYPDGRHIGTAGLVGSFSFSAPKIISTGQGGALITNDDEVAKKLRRLWKKWWRK
ncbi:DegT/DnrJ/EryC1/StrS family aminotransferase [Aliarcobacter butzleri]|uniref:DegT/DnrJ/EryC1/StrS family aminotransferase n=1 Tax=Aliarcobacter butzleri TaxID=28197 RepID=UPI002B24CD9E|nr:DegT/DnrJ/EryC1/StrS family aminotransferase [Aliarcobacter butzleri]